jgi:hypothetical protein
MKTVSFETAVTYKTIVLSAAHLSADMRNELLTMADNPNCFYCHRTFPAADTGIILRFAAGGGNWDDIEATLEDENIDLELLGLIEAIANEGFEAIHFDVDAELLAGAHWYLDSGSKVIPLGYELSIVGYDDLSSEHQAAARDQFYDSLNDDGFTASEFFNNEGDFNFVVIDGLVYSLSDCMRLDDGELKEFGFSGTFSESNVSVIAVTLSDDSDTLDAVRIC